MRLKSIITENNNEFTVDELKKKILDFIDLQSGSFGNDDTESLLKEEGWNDALETIADFINTQL